MKNFNNPESALGSTLGSQLGGLGMGQSRMDYLLNRYKENRPLIYLACAYNHIHKSRQQRRYEIVSEVAGKLVKAGNLVYSPITHSHPMEKYANVNGDREFWIDFDKFYMERSDILMILQITDAWKMSEGICDEIEFMADLGKPIIYMPYDEDDEPLPIQGPK